MKDMGADDIYRVVQRIADKMAAVKIPEVPWWFGSPDGEVIYQGFDNTEPDGEPLVSVAPPTKEQVDE